MTAACVYADFKHGLALWPGDEESVQGHFDNVRLACKRHKVSDEFARFARVLCVPDDVNESEMAQMQRTLRIPRRVSMRFTKGAFDAGPH
jgi:hypothetical protein